MAPRKYADRDQWVTARRAYQNIVMAQHSQQSEQPRKRGRDLPWGGPRPRSRPKAKPEPRLPQLTLFPESQATTR